MGCKVYTYEMMNNDLWKIQNGRNKLFQIIMLPILTNHSMKYFFTNDTGESTELLLTSQISEIAARKYPIAILYEKHNKNRNSNIM
jgi:hypothetical protein